MWRGSDTTGASAPTSTFGPSRRRRATEESRWAAAARGRAPTDRRHALGHGRAISPHAFEGDDRETLGRAGVAALEQIAETQGGSAAEAGPSSGCDSGDSPPSSVETEGQTTASSPGGHLPRDCAIKFVRRSLRLVVPLFAEAVSATVARASYRGMVEEERPPPQEGGSSAPTSSQHDDNDAPANQA